MRVRYLDDQSKRLETQFMSWSGVDTVVVGQPFRSDYGLPEQHEDKVYAVKNHVTKKKEKLTKIKKNPKRLREKNKEKLDMVLNPTYGVHEPERVLLSDVSLDEIREATKQVTKKEHRTDNGSDEVIGLENEFTFLRLLETVSS
uniref:Uncharacterized protein LOC100377342 n=1 Tax=Saccoglossus kowalevskii TaxID=10224 RepID=A0ABM0GX20_SACKO|nr:PREDICTED: uncharacterized protein LOC100377342 [Saccoglossus kowalevskii]